jgi:hypothetical protein
VEKERDSHGLHANCVELEDVENTVREAGARPPSQKLLAIEKDSSGYSDTAIEVHYGAVC